MAEAHPEGSATETGERDCKEHCMPGAATGVWPGHSGVCSQTGVVTEGCGHRRVWSQRDVVTEGCGHKGVWVQRGVVTEGCAR